MHEQEVGGIIFRTDLLRDTSRHRNSGYACGADQRIDLSAGDDAHQFAEQASCSSTEGEGDQTERDDLERCSVQESLCTGGCAYGGAQQDNNDVHKSVGSCLCQLTDNTALTEEVRILSSLDTGRSCDILILRSLSVVSARMMGGWMIGTRDM